ncbi:MAG: paraquat-inducible protein A [Pseudomonadota bacterium]
MSGAAAAGPVVTARETGRVACPACGDVWPRGRDRCGRCRKRLRSRDDPRLGAVWAWWAAGVLLYVPANLWPMLVTRTLGREEASTIFGGVLELIHHGSWGIAGVVFFASICIPVAKFAAIAILAVAVRGKTPLGSEALTKLYEVVEFVGRWSMIDIFVVAILAALVQLGFLASLAPGPAAGCFALSVAFTMLSARAFDPRLVWDRIGEAE